MTMKLRLKMKNRSHRYDINRPRPGHGHKYIKYKLCLSVMMVICIKQHLSNSWSSWAQLQFMKKLKGTRNSLKKWLLNLWWISNKTMMETENVTKSPYF